MMHHVHKKLITVTNRRMRQLIDIGIGLALFTGSIFAILCIVFFSVWIKQLVDYRVAHPLPIPLFTSSQHMLFKKTFLLPEAATESETETTHEISASSSMAEMMEEEYGFRIYFLKEGVKLIHNETLFKNFEIQFSYSADSGEHDLLYESTSTEKHFSKIVSKVVLAPYSTIELDVLVTSKNESDYFWFLQLTSEEYKKQEEEGSSWNVNTVSQDSSTLIFHNQSLQLNISIPPSITTNSSTTHETTPTTEFETSQFYYFVIYSNDTSAIERIDHVESHIKVHSSIFEFPTGEIIQQDCTAPLQEVNSTSLTCTAAYDGLEYIFISTNPLLEQPSITATMNIFFYPNWWIIGGLGIVFGIALILLFIVNVLFWIILVIVYLVKKNQNKEEQLYSRAEL